MGVAYGRVGTALGITIERPKIFKEVEAGKSVQRVAGSIACADFNGIFDVYR